ncbi:Hsp20/alpha crystallin family protein [Ruminiclostridium cellulolyticum]|uniref:Heat shock protein Hsp20 n=1 Tax=Ruminiclostridium cellulolyticum (strain ATCC 35319 / DSM 5812 / JCM 6584 / H10) TaxID=394503 RepID=B8I8D2_RUMCH|nr:Hsp20/alpha crystallin family protein [Ruminiclostridium cellulolyticum]ACL77232.1 heat shock protein Hsp20 [Ruminiclostridium cellulolyticum H10]
MFGIVPFRNHKLQERGSLFDIENMFNSLFNDSFIGFTGGNPIRADIKENDKEFIVEAEIPGVTKEDIKLDLRDDTLTIAVEQNQESNEERDNYIRKERRYGSFSRSFYVENVKNEDVSAKYENGILTIVLPKSETKKVKNRIEIQ